MGADNTPGVKGKVGILLEGSQFHVRNRRIQNLESTTWARPVHKGDRAFRFANRAEWPWISLTGRRSPF